MNCRYMILTFALGCLMAAPALYLWVMVCHASMPTTPIGFLAGGAGVIETVVAAMVALWNSDRWVPSVWGKAKAELDALMAGMRGEGK